MLTSRCRPRCLTNFRCRSCFPSSRLISSRWQGGTSVSQSNIAVSSRIQQCLVARIAVPRSPECQFKSEYSSSDEGQVSLGVHRQVRSDTERTTSDTHVHLAYPSSGRIALTDIDPVVPNVSVSIKFSVLSPVILVSEEKRKVIIRVHWGFLCWNESVWCS